MSTQNIIIAVGFLWLLVLSGLFAWIFYLFRKFTSGTDKKNLIKLLDDLINAEDLNSKDIKKVKKEIDRIEGEAKFNIKKVGFIRFNPFNEMGGDHSFSLALLDGTDSGIIITGLHARERTRMYVKNIKNGKSEHELSAEEKRALTKAQKSK